MAWIYLTFIYICHTKKKRNKFHSSNWSKLEIWMENNDKFGQSWYKKVKILTIWQMTKFQAAPNRKTFAYNK